ncbi:pyridoxamine 5'-phosphate oxidase family protein [Aminobacter carboxidus]|uniref:Pyridoxamine 5'-phosphate oxidase family protein n=1 Tax=Aminobacter carboxidus TaxID=376165 RepID=A0ABR9GRF8_9HYPH|nr:pyridoxamine 5'-phosphate oxidase family protein [Aminobacter carboxidus]MBE1206246.1 pyridoxamine 5'-phosphate oxidase family protein [Aminobacter carboxidus]
MPDKQAFEEKFWKYIRADMTVMLSVAGVDARPMTAQFDGERKTLYFFTAKDTEIAQKVTRARKATLVYAAKKHDLFATVHGTLRIDNDRETIDRLWNRFVAAWFEKGKDDPKLCLLRFEPADAQIWLDASSLVAGVKMFLGLGDPKKDYEDSVASVSLK